MAFTDKSESHARAKFIISDRQTISQIDRKTDSKTQIDRQTDRQSQTKTIETESVRYRQTKANLIRKQNT